MAKVFEGPTVILKSKLNEIVSFVNDNPMSYIVAPTASGKSIAIPAELSRRFNKKVYVGLPRKNLLYSLKNSQSIFNPELNIGVLEEQYSDVENKDIVYATSDVIRKNIISGIKNGKLYNITFTDYLVLDEVHVGNADNYLIIGLLKLFASKNFRIPKLLLMSASINEQRYKEFEVLRITDLNSYDIETMYHNVDYQPADRRVYSDIATVVSQYHIAYRDNLGTFLVFVPGKKEIDLVSAGLVKLENVKIIQVHSSTIKNAMREIYTMKSDKTRHIIIATNIFETSITIVGVILVVDSMLEKRSDTSGQGRLVTEYISKTSADQRKGRTGRTSSGKCYRMITKNKYELLAEEKEEEIYQIDLSQIIITLANVGVNPLDILPTGIRFKVRPLIGELKDLGLIKPDNNISEMGVFFTNFNLSLKAYAVLWWLLQTTETLYEGIIVVGILNSTSQSLLRLEIERKVNMTEFLVLLKKYKDRYYSGVTGRSELHTYINIVKAYYAYTGMVVTSHGFDEFCEENKINARVFRSLLNTIDTLISKLKDMGYYIEIPLVNRLPLTDDIVDLVRPIIRRAYNSDELYLLSPTKLIYATDGSDKEKQTYSFDLVSKLNTYDQDPPPKLVAIQTKTDTKGNHRITFSMNIEKYHIDDRLITNVKMLKEYTVKMPQRGRRTVSEIQQVRLPFVIDTNLMNSRLEVYPKTMEQGYVPIGKPKQIPLL